MSELARDVAGPKFPEVEVQLTGTDGNAFNLIGIVAKALRREVSPEAAAEFQTAAMASESYDAMLRVCMETVSVS